MIYSNNHIFIALSILLFSCNQPYEPGPADTDFTKKTSHQTNGWATDVMVNPNDVSEFIYIDDISGLNILDTNTDPISKQEFEKPESSNEQDSDTKLNGMLISDYTQSDDLLLFTYDNYNNIWGRRYSDIKNDFGNANALGDAVKCGAEDMVHGDNRYPVRFTVTDNSSHLFILFDHPLSLSTSNYDDSYILGKRTLYRAAISVDDEDGYIELQDGCTLMSEISYDGLIDSTLSFTNETSDVIYYNNSLYISNPTNNEITIITNPLDNTSSISHIAIDSPEEIFIYNDIIYVAQQGYMGVTAIDIDGNIIGSFGAGFTVKDVFVDTNSNFIALSCGYHGVLIYKIVNGRKFTDNIALSTSFAYSSIIQNNFVYVATKNGLEIIDLTEDL